MSNSQLNVAPESIDLNQSPAAFPETPPKDVDLQVGQNLRSGRNLRGLTQKKLGEAVGLTLQQIQKYENGSNRITVSRLHQFSEVLNVPVAHFFSGPVTENGPVEDATAAKGLKFSADDFEILSLTKHLSPRLKRRLICLMEEMSDTGPTESSSTSSSPSLAAAS